MPRTCQAKITNNFVSITSRLLYTNVMPKSHETLAEFVTRIAAEKELSYRKISERSSGQISHSTVAEIANGQRLDFKKDTLVGLAKGLGVPPEDVFRAARGITVNPTERYGIYAERFDAHDLAETEWQFLETYFKDTVDRFKAAKIEREKFLDEQARK